MIKFATYILKEIHYPMKKYLSNSLISIILGLLCGHHVHLLHR